MVAGNKQLDSIQKLIQKGFAGLAQRVQASPFLQTMTQGRISLSPISPRKVSMTAPNVSQDTEREEYEIVFALHDSTEELQVTIRKEQSFVVPVPLKGLIKVDAY